MFTDPEFYEAVYIHGPLRFDGYRFLDFYHANKRLDGDVQTLGHELCLRFQREFRLPNNEDLAMAIWFFFQRGHKNYGFPAGPNAPEDGTSFGTTGAWSHFYLLFLHLYRHTFPNYFQHRDYMPHWIDLINKGTPAAVATRIRHELLGYRGPQSGPAILRSGPADDYRFLAQHAAEKHWLPNFENAPAPLGQHPEFILALAFKANGFANMMTSGTPPLWQPCGGETAYLVDRTMRLLSSESAFSPDDDENRAGMFMIALWLIEHPEQSDFNSRDHLVFSLLYLHLYRQPLSEYFTRSAFAKRWTATPFAEKEAVAADMRRNLVRIRNEAARSDPASSPPGGPC
jgi:hypothetical protein